METVTWRFLGSSPAPGPRQMAIDDALLTLCGQGQSPPTLRLFSFRPPCLSLGRFQPAQALDGLQVVRRPTGGRAVLHRGDICYSVVAPANHPLVAGSIRQSYQKIARALAEGLAILGLSPLRPAFARSRPPGTAWCFDAVAPYELTLNGAKLVGSAQVRRHGALLQQGSIRLAPDGRGQSIEEVLGRRLQRREVAQALVEGFARAWGVDFRPGRLSAEEEELAQRLEGERYADAAWTWWDSTKGNDSSCRAYGHQQDNLTSRP
ncbi:MAG: biotin/lipoate A/B protein ligase family protein [Chloroflexota bacterium]|nr:biotin/lipoate A/B protein ligase family protein [Chloroflexota bacterium]